MVLPIVTPAPIVVSHGDAFRDLFDNQREFRHFQNYLTGLIVLENTSMANIANCILDQRGHLNRYAVHRISVQMPPLVQDAIGDVRHARILKNYQASQIVLKMAKFTLIIEQVAEGIAMRHHYRSRGHDWQDHSLPSSPGVTEVGKSGSE